MFGNLRGILPFRGEIKNTDLVKIQVFADGTFGSNHKFELCLTKKAGSFRKAPSFKDKTTF